MNGGKKEAKFIIIHFKNTSGTNPVISFSLRETTKLVTSWLHDLLLNIFLSKFVVGMVVMMWKLVVMMNMMTMMNDDDDDYGNYYEYL